MLLLDSGALSFLAERGQRAAGYQVVLRRSGLWPPAVASVVLVESLTGQASRDASVNRLLRMCNILDSFSEKLVRRAAWLRTQARRGSAVDALVVALAEPDGIVLTQDAADLRALASHAVGVTIRHP